MAIHDSSVNFENLIRDLADMYSFDVGTVVLVELVANSLDSGANIINITYDTQRKILTITDNGNGMNESDFAQYHDFAAGLKTRGDGIGFAGVGAKISFNIASRVITETRSDTFSGGSNWYLESKNKLSWEDIEPLHINNKGTRVEVRFKQEAYIPFSSSASVEHILKQHYLPLFDNEFLSIYSQMFYYPKNLRFIINDKIIEPALTEEDLKLDNIRKFVPTRSGKRIGYGLFGLTPNEYQLGDGICGVLLCTRGKVIKADMFNQFPSNLGPRILGIVEIPEFIHYLTSAKTDFIKRKRYKEFEKLYDPVRREFRQWLDDLGVQSTEVSASDEALKLERELKKLIDEVPELNEFFGFRSPKNVLFEVATGEIGANLQEGAEITFPMGEGESMKGQGLLDIGDGPGEALQENIDNSNKRTSPITRTSKRGPKVAFSDAPDRIDMSWIDGTNVVINSSHPAYKKASIHSNSKRLHSLFAISLAIQKFLFTGQVEDLMFSDKMMSAWGKK